MEILPDGLTHEATYKLLTGTVVPRPIAWITTLSSAGKVNAAPFSAFVIVSTDPGMVGFSVSRRDGEVKDTERNVLERGEFVVNIADTSLLEPLHRSSAAFPPDVSEVEALGLQTAASRFVSVPRLAAAPAAFECRLHGSTSYGRQHRFVVGEIVLYHFRDGLVVDGKIDARTLDPIARIGGPHYASLGPITTLPPVGPRATGGG